MDDLEVWGERAVIAFRCAKEINETGETCVDTYMECMRLGITPEDVARALRRIHELEEEEENENDGEE